jgi:hypothetical protein
MQHSQSWTEHTWSATSTPSNGVLSPFGSSDPEAYLFATGTRRARQIVQLVQSQSEADAQLVVQPERQRPATRPTRRLGTSCTARAWRPPVVARLTLR